MRTLGLALATSPSSYSSQYSIAYQSHYQYSSDWHYTL